MRRLRRPTLLRSCPPSLPAIKAFKRINLPQPFDPLRAIWLQARTTAAQATDLNGVESWQQGLDGHRADVHQCHLQPGDRHRFNPGLCLVLSQSRTEHQRRSAQQVVQVLGRTPLAPRQQLVLLRLGSKLVLVSNLHGEVRTLSEITDPLEVDRLAGLCEAAQPGSISESFRSVLHNIGGNG